MKIDLIKETEFLKNGYIRFANKKPRMFSIKNYSLISLQMDNYIIIEELRNEYNAI